MYRARVAHWLLNLNMDNYITIVGDELMYRGMAGENCPEAAGLGPSGGRLREAPLPVNGEPVTRPPPPRV